MGCDLVTFEVSNLLRSFLLTHPVWDVTSFSSCIYLPSIISTHTSRVGCDWRYMTITGQLSHFYSHIPCGMWPDNGIPNYGGTNFYSHIPCGMWQCNFNSQQLVRQFLLTHPGWDVTIPKNQREQSQEISTHTSRVGCDQHSTELIIFQLISTHTSRVGCD